MDIDALIVELIESGRRATEEELSQIVAHVAQAPFASRPVRPPGWLREALARLGITMPARVPAGEAHLLKRVYYDQQWPVGTTTDRFVADLRLAIRHPDACVWTYEYFGEPCVGLLAPSHIRGTPGAKPYIFVAYSARYGTLTTGYQASGPETIFNEKHQQLTQHR
ncbi:MAG: hypothetical protein ISS50_08280 [Anaerolineae bacterium]|nr:hypothetical protein [Anaerolineae bacterium]